MAIQSDLFDLSNKVAVVTGSSKGIGRSIATAMAAAGRVTVHDASDESSNDSDAWE